MSWARIFYEGVIEGFKVGAKQGAYMSSRALRFVTGKAYKTGEIGNITSKWTARGEDIGKFVLAASGLAGVIVVVDLGISALTGTGKAFWRVGDKLDNYAKISIAATACLAALYIVTRKR